MSLSQTKAPPMTGIAIALPISLAIWAVLILLVT